MANVNFCSTEYTKEEVLEEIKKILILPDLHNAIKKYNNFSETEQEEYYKKIKREAYKKWHSDVRTTINEKAEFYSKCISEALDIFKIVASNPDYFTEPVNEDINFSEEKEQNHDVSFSEMQEKLRNSINKIFKQANKTKETVILSKGSLYSDIIQEEQEAKIYEPTCYAMLFYGLIFLVHTSNTQPTPENLTVTYFLTFLLSVCFLYLIPFSRYWLFSKIPYAEVICGNVIVNLGSVIFMKIIQGFNKLSENNSKSKSGDSWVFDIFFIIIALYLIMFRLFVFIFGLVMLVFYQIALSIVKDKRFKDVTKEQVFFDGVAEWYIYEIISKAENELTEQEKDLINHFYVNYLNK